MTNIFLQFLLEVVKMKRVYIRLQICNKPLKDQMTTHLAGDSETSKSNFSSANEQKSIEIKHW